MIACYASSVTGQMKYQGGGTLMNEGRTFFLSVTRFSAFVFGFLLGMQLAGTCWKNGVPKIRGNGMKQEVGGEKKTQLTVAQS